ncbi:hypothetical protein HK096_002509, partial [Nowakowskiella sp. JEL0078]
MKRLSILIIFQQKFTEIAIVDGQKLAMSITIPSKVCFLHVLRFVDERIYNAEHPLQSDRFATAVAILCASDKKVVAAQVILKKDQSVVRLANNDPWNANERAYIAGLHDLMVKVARDKSVNIANVETNPLVSNIEDLIVEHCEAKFRSRLSKLGTLVNKLWAKSLVRVKILELAPNLFAPFTTLDMMERSEACQKVAGVLEPPGTKLDKYEIKAITGVKKLASYLWAYQVIVGCSISAKYRGVIATSSFELLNGERQVVTVDSWTKMSKKYCTECEVDPVILTRDIKSDENYSERMGVVYANGPDKDATVDGVCIHAEMLLIQEWVREGHWKGRMFIGVSKQCCWMCSTAIDTLNRGDMKIAKLGDHGKLYHRWIPPTLHDKDLQKLFTAELHTSLDVAIKAEIVEYTNAKAESDSYAHSLSSSIDLPTVLPYRRKNKK